MNDLYLTDEDIHGVFDENVAEKEKLQNKIDKLQPELENAVFKITNAIIKINHDKDVSKRCMEESLNGYVKRLFELQIQFDNELLEILSDEK